MSVTLSVIMGVTMSAIMSVTMSVIMIDTMSVMMRHDERPITRDYITITPDDA